MTSCPACHKAVDPLRSRFVGVRDGKVVAFCSAECAASASPEAASAGAAPAAARGPASAAAAAAPAAASVARALSPATGIPTPIPTPASGIPAGGARTPAKGVTVGRAAPPAGDVPSGRGQPPASDVPSGRGQPPASDVPSGHGQATTGGAPSGREQTPVSGVPAPEQAPGSSPPGAPFGIESGPVIEILHEPTSGVLTSARDERDEQRARHPDEIPIAAFWSADKKKGRDRDKDRARGKDRNEIATGDAGAGAVAAVGEPAELAVVPPSSDGDHDIPPTRQIRTFRVATDGEIVLAPRSRWPIVVVIALLVVGGGVALYYVYGRPAAHGSSSAVPRSGGAAPRGDESRAARGMAAAALPHAAGARTVAAAGVALPAMAATGVAPPAMAAAGVAPAVPAAGVAPSAMAAAGVAPPAMAAAGLAPAVPAAGVAPSVIAAAGVAPPASAPPAVTLRAVDPAAAVDQARTALRSDLAATSLRVQRLAAAALARTADSQAVALLAAQLGLVPAAPAGASAAVNLADDLAHSDIARLGLAYALARAGDVRGRDVLAGALGSPRAEARDEASRLLALLGDRRAVPHLLDLLAVAQRRLGAAEHLARLAEPHALDVLGQIRRDARESPDDKARATVALGIAGRAEVAGALHDMLADPHFNAFAGAALAALADRAAWPVLERQLASPPLRVLAARALRRLDPTLDPRPLLPALLEVVRTGRDVDRIPAAEAILVLAGPARWAAYD